MSITVAQVKQAKPNAKSYKITDGNGLYLLVHANGSKSCKESPGAYMRAVLSLVPKDFALTAEKDETPQCIEIRFVD